MGKRSYSQSLMRQMAECDANYIRLLRLMPRLARGCLPQFGRAGQGQERQSPKTRAEFHIADFKGVGPVTVAMEVVEAFKYTTGVLITQSPKMLSWLDKPTMLVRLYHDTATAEVISYQGQRGFKPRYPQPNPMMYQPDEKLHINMFLGEWLGYCLKVGRCTAVPEISVS